MLQKKQSQKENQRCEYTEKQDQLQPENKLSSPKVSQALILGCINVCEKRAGFGSIQKIPQFLKDQINDEQSFVRATTQKLKAGSVKKNVKLIYDLMKKVANNTVSSKQQVVNSLQAIMNSMSPLAIFHEKLQKFTKFVILSEQKFQQMKDLILDLQFENKNLKKQVGILSNRLAEQSIDATQLNKVAADDQQNTFSQNNSLGAHIKSI